MAVVLIISLTVPGDALKKLRRFQSKSLGINMNASEVLSVILDALQIKLKIDVLKSSQDVDILEAGKFTLTNRIAHSFAVLDLIKAARKLAAYLDLHSAISLHRLALFCFGLTELFSATAYILTIAGTALKLSPDLAAHLPTDFRDFDLLSFGLASFLLSILSFALAYQAQGLLYARVSRFFVGIGLKGQTRFLHDVNNINHYLNLIELEHFYLGLVHLIRFFDVRALFRRSA